MFEFLSQEDITIFFFLHLCKFTKVKNFSKINLPEQAREPASGG
jgi:hypothetical protein